VSEGAPGATEALSQVHAQAQLEALRRFGDGPATPWQPDVPVRGLVLRSLLVIAAGAAIAATAWALAPSDPDVADAPTASAPESARIEASVQDEDIVDADPAPMPGAPLPTSPARQDVGPASLVVERAGAGWRIDAAHASRLDAARRLAQLSGSPLLGATELIAGTRPLDLRWQGRDLAGAWQAVLGPELNYLLQCRRDRCQAWIVAAAEPGANQPLTSPPPVMTQAVDTPARADTGDQPDRLHHD
jgi:hypothetical protein